MYLIYKELLEYIKRTQFRFFRRSSEKKNILFLNVPRTMFRFLSSKIIIRIMVAYLTIYISLRYNDNLWFFYSVKNVVERNAKNKEKYICREL